MSKRAAYNVDQVTMRACGVALRIGELARRAEVSTRSLRHYESLGLITSTRLDNGYRSYGEDAVVRVRNIRSLLGVGLTCEEIQQLGPCLDRDLAQEPVCDAALDVYHTRRRNVEGRIVALLDTHRRVQRALEHLQAQRGDRRAPASS